MIICICANLNEKRIRAAVENGHENPAEVFAACGAPLDSENPRKDRCLKCVPEVRQIIHNKVIPIKPA